MMPDKEIFRQASIERLSSPEQLDQLMQVTHPRGWLALIGLGIFLTASVIWGFYSTISTTVVGQGMIISTEGVSNIVSNAAGQIKSLSIKTGDVVKKGQTIATLFRWDTDYQVANQMFFVTSPYAGRIIEMKTETGAFVDKGAPIAGVEPLSPTLEAVLYVSQVDGKKVNPGMNVQLAPSTIKPEEYGYIFGKVKSVSLYPVTKDGVQLILGSKDLTEKFFEAGAPYEMRVTLLTDAGTPSGYKWSSRGPDISVNSGTFSSAKIVIREQNPVSLIFPSLKKSLGFYSGPVFDEN